MTVPVEAGQCPRCLQPADDGRLCPLCVDLYERAVVNLAALLPELATTIARRDQVARAVVHRWTEPQLLADVVVPERSPFALAPHPLPINVDAVDLAGDVRRILRGTAVALRGHGPVCAAGLRCGHWSCVQSHGGVQPLTGWLLGRVDPLRRHVDAAGLVSDVAGVARRVEAMVDRRPADCFVGPCDAGDLTAVIDAGGVIRLEQAMCGADLYCRLGDRTVTCPACGVVYDVRHRRGWLLDAARDVWAYPAVIVVALAALDVDLTLDRLYKWISRDRLLAESGPRLVGPVCGGVCRHWSCRAARPLLVPPTDPLTGVAAVDGEGRLLYRVGDVLARVEALRAAKRAADREVPA